MKFTCKFVLFNTQISRKAYFNGESFIASSQKVSLLSEFEGGFNFRTLQPNGLLFYYSEGVSTSFFTVYFFPLDCYPGEYYGYNRISHFIF